MSTKFSGIIPAFYACYESDGTVSVSRTRELTRWFINKGVQGLYVCGSSGECIYLDIDERKKILEAVCEEAAGKLKIIAHVAANNTRDSMILAKHAQALGVDAIAAIPPIYFHLPEHSIKKYWNDISSAAPNTSFIIYNIPQLAGVALTKSLLTEMLKNPNVAGVKNSSMPTQDIQIWKALGGNDFTVFNGPDEQYVSGRVIGADAGIGGTYGAMPELYLKMEELIASGNYGKAREIQYACNEIIEALCNSRTNMYAMIKESLRLREEINIGGVRAPLTDISECDIKNAQHCAQLITNAIKRFC